MRLDGTQWAISICLGAFSLVIGVVVRLIPDAFLRSVVSMKWRAVHSDTSYRDNYDGRVATDDNRALISAEEGPYQMQRPQGRRLLAWFRFLRDFRIEREDLFVVDEHSTREP